MQDLVFTFETRPRLEIKVRASSEPEAWEIFLKDVVEEGGWESVATDIELTHADAQEAKLTRVDPYEPFEVTFYYVTDCTAEEFIPKLSDPALRFTDISDAFRKRDELNALIGPDDPTFGVCVTTFECTSIGQPIHGGWPAVKD